MNKQNSFSNKTIEALKMAIEAMYDAGFFIDGDVGYPIFFEKAIKACKEALAEAEKQEPVALIRHENGNFSPAPSWQGLTSEEILSLDLDEDVISVIFQTEKLLKEKNYEQPDKSV